LCGFRVGPLVTDDEGSVEVEAPLESGLEIKPRLGFVAGMSRIIRGANVDIVKRETLAKNVVHEVQITSGHESSGERWLVGGGYEHKPVAFELKQKAPRILVYAKLIDPQGRGLLPAVCLAEVQHPVSFKEYRWFHIATLRAQALPISRKRLRVNL
jgi:hypothetical protein